MKSLNSDQLRRRLSANNCVMNVLTEENGTIVELLRHRGLEAVRMPEAPTSNDDVSYTPTSETLRKLGEALLNGGAL